MLAGSERFKFGDDQPFAFARIPSFSVIYVAFSNLACGGFSFGHFFVIAQHCCYGVRTSSTRKSRWSEREGLEKRAWKRSGKRLLAA